jgi:hypothetical protein
MKRTAVALLGSAFVVTVLSIGAEPLLAHHGRGNTYEIDGTHEIHGIVKEVRWRNPHIAFLVDVTDDSGEVATWTLEHSNVSTLARLGYGRATLRPGMEIDVVMNPCTMDRTCGLNRGVTLEDGTQIFLRGVSDETPGRLNPFGDTRESVN